MKFYPLKLKPVTKSAIWGGRKIPEKYGIGESGSSVAEAWMLTLRPDGVNVIENGEYAGMTLEEYAEKAGKENVYGNGEFPLLVKIIDAADKLSVQVHPDDEYAHSHGLDAGKTEMWYVLEAEPGAELVAGIKDRISGKEIAEYAENGECEKYLNSVPVKKGDCFFIPSGLVHAIGGGILIAEIQQNSNTTYRLYDYERVGADGKKRELHIQSASETVKTEFDMSGVEINKTVCAEDGVKTVILSKCEFFSAVKYEIEHLRTAEISDGGQMLHVMCVSGGGEIVCGQDKYELKAGYSYLLPKNLGKCSVSAKTDIEIIVSAAE